MVQNYNIVCDLANSARLHGDRSAICDRHGEHSFALLSEMASKLGHAIKPHIRNGRVGVLGSRSFEAYVGCAGAAWAGAAYVPLNLKWPEERLVKLLDELELDVLVVDSNGAALVTETVRKHAPDAIFVADAVDTVEGAVRFKDLPSQRLERPVHRSDDETAYIVFTSGSTGEPKGVIVSCGALKQYLDNTEGWTNFAPDDRIAEAHDLTFDLSVHNMFLAWRAGASLHLMSQLDMMAPQAFIRNRNITCWMSVPTIVNNMRRNRILKPGIFPSLRLSVFCGEPLAVSTATDWAQAAPQSVVENIYGPTEGTVVCTRQRLTDPPVVTEQRKILSIGESYPNFSIVIRDAEGRPMENGRTGEITIAGDQLSDGYFKRQEQTERSFRIIDGRRWYFTGDLGYQDDENRFHHMGRVDNQVKLKGNRIELEEVEMHLRRVCGTDLAVVVAWPIVDGSAQGLVAFVDGDETDERSLRAGLAVSIPEYMIPARFVFQQDLPRNINDKIDRNALLASLEASTELTTIAAPDLVPDLASKVTRPVESA